MQLLKHALGLGRQRGNTEFSPYYNEFCLYYLYYDWKCKESENHKAEIECFADRVRKELRFKALRYQDVYDRLKAATPPDVEYQDYLHYLGDRYFCGKGVPK